MNLIKKETETFSAWKEIRILSDEDSDACANFISKLTFLAPVDGKTGVLSKIETHMAKSLNGEKNENINTVW